MAGVVLLESLFSRTQSVRRSKRASRKIKAIQLDNTASMFTINATNGTLSLVAAVATGSAASRLAIDPSGHFAYVANENGASVSIYTLKKQ
jgi:6-phosphogluconolactonase (cycloisomerase 2 family)